MVTNLLPCPFCGSMNVKPMTCEDPYPDVGFTIDPVVIVCLSCGTSGPSKQYQSEEEAITAWNTRR